MVKELWRQICWFVLPESWYRKIRDDCEVCQGRHRGVWGNENVIDVNGTAVVMCDTCSMRHHMRQPA